MEGCGYRDRQADFEALGVEIVGVSFDSPATNQSWAEDEEFGFELWTDDDRALAVYYGSVSSESAAIPGRVTRLLDADGTLVLEYQVSSLDAHPQRVLEDCQALFGSGD